MSDNGAPGLLADPRPVAANDERAGGWRLQGGRCQACRTPLARMQPRCPVCKAAVTAEQFGPTGEVYSCTTVHVDSPRVPAPYMIAYVDFEDGPRALAHVIGDGVAVGDKVELTAPSEVGNLQVEAVG
jgi:uncharacterized OB-fold protein